MHAQGTTDNPGTQQEGAFNRRIALIFALQLVVVVIVCLMGFYNVAPLAAVLAIIAFSSLVAWMAIHREWRPIHKLARYLSSWDQHSPDPDSFKPPALGRRSNADLLALSGGVSGMATRIAGFNERERNFTRDASHELRSPLTVIKMSTDMLFDEVEISSFGQRSLQRIRRATREMESLVEALLILARESDNGSTQRKFVVNDVLREELEEARGLLKGRPVELVMDEPVSFSVYGPPRVFAVLCWQLIRNACQQTEQGRITVAVAPGQITVSNLIDVSNNPVDRHGFELAIAQRVCERFDWPLELHTHDDREQVAIIRFPETMPIAA